MSPDATTIEQPAAGATPAASEAATQQAPVSRDQVAQMMAEWDRSLFGPKAQGDGRSDGKQANGTADNPPADPSGVPADTAATAGDGANADDDEGEETTETTTTTAEGQPPPEKPKSRTARLHEEYQGKIDGLTREHETTVSDLTTKVTDLQRQLDEATGKVSEAEQRRRADTAAFLAAFGDDAEYERRTRIANRMFDPNYTGPTLTNEEAAELARWTTTRDHAEPLKERYLGEARQLVERANEDAREMVKRAGKQFQEYIAAETISRVEKHGLDPEVVGTAEYGALLDHAVEVTTKRLTEKHAAELQAERDKVSQLEADLRAAETAGLADRTAPLPGGNSADVRVTARRVFDPKLPLDQQWDAAFSRQNGSGVR